MRYAIMTDIHANFDALKAVFDDIDKVNHSTAERISQIWCLGDIVGYGPEPSECVRLVRGRCTFYVAGNHDWAAARKIDLADFNEHAADSAKWTQAHLHPADVMFLRSLPEVTSSPIHNFTLAHGSPAEPIWEYLTTPDAAAYSFEYFESLYCLVGHTHLPTVFIQRMTDHETPLTAQTRVVRQRRAITMAEPGGPTRSSLESGQYAIPRSRSATMVPTERWNPPQGLCTIPEGYRAIVNPGSVGQPRDGDNRAAYVIYDSELGFDFRRVPYNIHETHRKIRALGLDERLAERLWSAN